MPDTFVGVRLFIVSKLTVGRSAALLQFDFHSTRRTIEFSRCLGRWKDDGSQSCEGGGCGQRRTKPTAAVTGAGRRGSGGDIALGLAAKNYRVFGTAMTPGEIADPSRGIWWRCDSDPLRPSQTKSASPGTGARDMSQRRTEPRLDLLISNAGIFDAWAPGGSVAFPPSGVNSMSTCSARSPL